MGVLGYCVARADAHPRLSYLLNKSMEQVLGDPTIFHMGN